MSSSIRGTSSSGVAMSSICTLKLFLVRSGVASICTLKLFLVGSGVAMS